MGSNPHSRVAQMRSAGMSEDVIFNRLLLEGWNEGDLKEYFSTPELSDPTSHPAMLAETPHLEVPAPIPELHDPPTESAVRTEISVEKQSVVPVQPRRLLTKALVFVGLAVVGSTGIIAYSFLQPPNVYSISIAAAAADSSSSTPATLSYGALPALSDPNYYQTVKEALTSQKASFIVADLSDMKLTLYKDGADALEVPILAKGRVGSWWETPVGIYKIETKEKNHFSSFGNVNMPYSLDFQGNFFIHGWPTYEDGTPVASTYSGGCIRLASDDAANLFTLASTGMPVIVYNTVKPASIFGYELKAPSISSGAYLIADLDSGTVLSSAGINSSALIASITKLVTALVATEYINLDKTVYVPPSAIVYTSIPRLEVGSSVRAYDLLYLLLQESSNEAAEVLASAVGRDEFVRHMNEKVKAIGLQNTIFSDSSGASNDYSTPEDLFKLLRYIHDNRSFVFGITAGTLRDTAYGGPHFSDIQNFNLIPDATLVGGKIGKTTSANETYAGIFSIPVGDTSRNMVIVVLGSNDSAVDVKTLYDFVRNSYKSDSVTP